MIYSLPHARCQLHITQTVESTKRFLLKFLGAVVSNRKQLKDAFHVTENVISLSTKFRTKSSI